METNVEYPLQAPQKYGPGAVVGAQYCLQRAEQFTMENAVFRKHWSITNANGTEVFRVRGKKLEWSRAKRELVDLQGNTIVLMEEKMWSISNGWRAFDPRNKEEPLWTMKSYCSWGPGPKLKIFLPHNRTREHPDYTVKGSWLCKKCNIFFGDNKVAEVVRDVSFTNVLVAKSIFHVTVQPGVDIAFIFSIVVIMDKIYIHDTKSGGGGGGVGGGGGGGGCGGGG